MNKLFPVILCGGSGTRLWPLSGVDKPKQFLNLLNEYSLLQNTALRLLRVTNANAQDFLSVTSETLAPLVREHLSALTPDLVAHIIEEPSSRNTAPAILLALRYIERMSDGDDDPLLLVCPSDAHIGDEAVFSQALARAMDIARQEKIVIFGITPRKAETGFGYIRQGSAYHNSGFHVDRFTEKPCLEDAQQFLLSGDYLWNSGIFLFKASTLLKEFRAHAPEYLDAQNFEDLPALPFDKAILEKSGEIVVVPMDPDWSDLGSWERIWEISDKDADGNSISGNALLNECRNCLIKAGNGKKLTLSGLENTVVVEMDDLIYIGSLNDAYAPARLLKKLA